MRLLEADLSPGEALADVRQQAACGLDERHSLDLAPAPRVAEVGEERRVAVRLHQHSRVRARESGQVADVRLPAEDVRRAGDEQGLVENRRESLDAPGHFCIRNSSASR
jgi:hypothetical protein